MKFIQLLLYFVLFNTIVNAEHKYNRTITYNGNFFSGEVNLQNDDTVAFLSLIVVFFSLILLLIIINPVLLIVCIFIFLGIIPAAIISFVIPIIIISSLF